MSVFKEPTTHKTPALDVNVTLRAYVRTYVRPSTRRVLRAQHPAESRAATWTPKNILIAAGAQIPIYTFPTSDPEPVVIFN